MSRESRLNYKKSPIVPTLYLIASALAQFNCKRLAFQEVILRLVLATLIMIGNPIICGIAIVWALGWILFHNGKNRTVMDTSGEGNAGLQSTQAVGKSIK